MTVSSLEEVARQLVCKGKGILAADESSPTIRKRLAAIGVESTEENRLKYRNLLFTTEGIEEFISGVILFEETLLQVNKQGIPLVDILLDKGIIPGIKVDKGTQPLTNYPGETITQGLDDLKKRLDGYVDAGAKFSKWRGVIKLSEQAPTPFAIKSNAHALARFAALSQQAGLVPIVEPEILMDGRHTLEQCEIAASETLIKVFEELFNHRVNLEEMLLKASMMTSGADCPQQASIAQVRDSTLRVLSRTLPTAVPGVVFLSGGQSAIQATTHLNALNQQKNLPWELSFSFGRALQEPVLKTWQGMPDNIPQAQQQLYQRAKLNSEARFGSYCSE
jgi:fructose-bisphosphate aldolase class I